MLLTAASDYYTSSQADSQTHNFGKFLNEIKFDVTSLNNNKQTIFHCMAAVPAAWLSLVSAIEECQGVKQLLSQVDDNKQNVFHIAVIHATHDLRVLTPYITLVDVNQKDIHGRNLIHSYMYTRSKEGYPTDREMVKTLIEEKSSISFKSDDGSTTLRDSLITLVKNSEYFVENILRFLVSAHDIGEALTATNAKGETVLQELQTWETNAPSILSKMDVERSKKIGTFLQEVINLQTNETNKIFL